MPQLKKQRRQNYVSNGAKSSRARDIISACVLFLLGFLVYEGVLCYAVFGEMQVSAAPKAAIVAPTEPHWNIPIPVGTPLYLAMPAPTTLPIASPTFPPVGLSSVAQPTKAPAPTLPSQPTVVPTGTTNWTTIQTYSGNGDKKTSIISVPNDWRIAYTCQGMNADGQTSDGLLTVSVDNSTNTPVDPGAVNVICKAGKTTSDVTEEHAAGQIFLDIIATSSWTIQVQIK